MKKNNKLPMEHREESQDENLGKSIIKVFSTYFTGKLKIALILGILAFLFLGLLKIPYKGFISIIIAVSNLIPYIGPIIGGIVAVSITLISTNLSKGLWMLGIMILLQIIDGWYLEPKILGKAFGINPIMIFIIVFIGGVIFGIPGMIFGVPIAVIIRILYKKIRSADFTREP